MDHALAARDAHVDDVAGDLDGVREDAVDVVLAGGAGVRALPRAGGLKGVAMVSPAVWSIGAVISTSGELAHDAGLVLGGVCCQGREKSAVPR